MATDISAIVILIKKEHVVIVHRACGLDLFFLVLFLEKGMSSS